ncbi:hypothetical protein E2562_037534 [Oryza meyeriana var. granulata]|uniref:peptidylprolyl isomerase n=1 Tax=Oryza meyeriana var. granulata TaxID=110450 RepID=A0A6G1E8V6_9ORYZ|nr:hypothetical protein E2562_037534 [Oryza meyeriana var. granulata]
MALSELGEPDKYLDDLRHPGFAKWTVQGAAIPTRRRRKQLGFLYCKEAQGEKAVFVIPPELADTESRCPASIPGNIPPNQALRFDIELISLVTIIDIFDDEGILKKIIKDGTGSGSPRAFDQVLVSYNACMQDGVSVSKSEGVEFNLAKDGFGEQGRPSIENEAAVPPDATLYVYLQLMSYKRAIHIGEGHTIFKKTLRQGKWTKMYPNQAMVRVRLIGKLQDGAVFDRRGHEGEEPFEFMVDEEQVSDSLEKAVLTMWEGEIALFTIPTQTSRGTLGQMAESIGSTQPAPGPEPPLQLWADSYEPADLRGRRIPLSMSVMKPKQGRHKPGGKIFVPPIKRPDANVPTGHSPATQATSDVNRSRVTTNNENQNSGTITSPRRATVLASDGVLDHGLNLTEFGSEQGTK